MEGNSRGNATGTFAGEENSDKIVAAEKALAAIDGEVQIIARSDMTPEIKDAVSFLREEIIQTRSDAAEIVALQKEVSAGREAIEEVHKLRDELIAVRKERDALLVEPLRPGPGWSRGGLSRDTGRPLAVTADRRVMNAAGTLEDRQTAMALQKELASRLCRPDGRLKVHPELEVVFTDSSIVNPNPPKPKKAVTS